MNSQAAQNSPHLYYFNALFDLCLGGYNTEKFTCAAAEMSCLFIPLGSSHDKIILDISVSDDYFKYLTLYGIGCPHVLSENEQCKGTIGDPWGWDEGAVERFTKVGAECVSPDLTVVKSINSHYFSYQFNKKTGTGIPGAQCCSSKDELIQALKSWKRFPLVIKPEFGNVGYGFIHKEDPVLSYRELKKADILFRAGKHVIVEPWLNRLTDISSRCCIDRDGTITDIRHHQGLTNKVGKFYAVLIDPGNEVIGKWREALDRAAMACAQELYEAGYFGPVGFDSMTWSDESGKENLAAILEINARHPMSSVAYTLHDRLAPNRVTMLMFTGNKKLILPDNYKSFQKLLGDKSFDTGTRKGAILLTPLRAHHKDDTWTQPERSVFFLAEETVEKARELDKNINRILSE